MCVVYGVREGEAPEWDNDHTCVAVATARHLAARRACRARLQAADRDDLQQDILLAIVERSRRFDPAHAGWANLGSDATWQRGAGPAIALRVLRSSPDQLRDVFGTTLVQATDVLTVPIAVLPDIAAGDMFTLGTEILTVQHAERDAAGVAWRVLCQR